MAVNKAHDEFHTLDMSTGWETRQVIRPVFSKKSCQARLMR